MRLSERHPNDCLLQDSFQRNKVFITINDGTPYNDINIQTKKNQSNDCKRSTITNGKTKLYKINDNKKCSTIEHLHSNRILLFILTLLLLLNVDAVISESIGQQRQLSQPSQLTPCEPKVLEDLQVDPVSNF